MFKKGIRFFMGALLVLGAVGPVCADSVTDEITLLKARLAALEEKQMQKSLSGSSIEILEGVSVEFGMTSVVQITDNANGSTLSVNGDDVTDASYSVDIAITKEFENGIGFIALEAGEGDGVDDELEVFSGVNADATGSASGISVTEAWYQHNAEPFYITAGKVAADAFLDANEYAGDEATQFLGTAFKNSATIALPDNGAGLIVGASVSDALMVEAIIMDADADFEDIDEDAFYGAQLTFSPEIGGRAGNYRFFVWQTGQNHTKWVDATQTEENNMGYGLSLDQEVTDGFGVFVRYAWQDPDVYANGSSESLESSWSVGMQLAGSSWGRDEDAIGVAYGQIKPSDKYKDSNSALKANNEGHLELYYSYKVNEYFTVTPDIQVIKNPYGGDAANGDKTITVLGLRGQLDF